MAVGKWHLAKDSDASRGSARLVAVPARVRPVLRRHRRVHEPAPPAPARAGQPSRRDRPLPRRLLLHRRHHRPRDLDDPRPEDGEPGPAVLLLRRPRRGARAAARPARGRRQVPRPLRRGLGRAARRALRPPAGARRRAAEGVELAPRNTERDHDVRPWDDLSAEEQRLFARHMEVYAGMVDRIDQNIGRMVAALDELGELDNTIFVFTLRQRRVARGRGRAARPRTTCTCCRATTSTPTSPASTRSAAPRPRRTTRAAGRWRATRRSGCTRSTPTRAATRCRSSCRGPTGSTSAASSAASTST